MNNSLNIKIMNILFEIQDFSLNNLNFIDGKVILEIKKKLVFNFFIKWKNRRNK